MKHNTIRLYKHFCDLIENPVGEDEKERKIVRKNAIRSKEDLEQHFRKGKKYRNDPEILELLGEKKVEEKPKEEVKNGEPKRRNKSA